MSEKRGIIIENYSEFVIFTYSTEHLLKKDKVRFYYALKGRDGESGVVKRFNIEHLGRTVLMVPKEFEKDLDQFFEIWKCPVEKKEVLVKK
ncbi:hypothetical protein KY337_05750 [Candidatus Woesearchaeota archaeon]|nr:hypothetical protein [Candidatus Woesearchaeota archaeon]